MAEEEKPAASVGPDGEMRSELQELQLQMNTTTDESLESTRRMLSMCEESQDMGVKTIALLDAQGEQLDRVEEGMDQINQDMRDAEKNLEGMEKCCGLCVLPWKKTKNFEKGGDYANTWGKNDDGCVNADGPRQIVGEQTMISGGFVTRITNDAREDEMEQNISEVSGMVGNLRNMAIDMGNEVSSQNRQIDRVNQKALSLDDRVQSANKRTNELLRKS